MFNALTFYITAFINKSSLTSLLKHMIYFTLFLIGMIGVLIAISPVAYAQDMAGVAVDMAKEMRDLPVNSTIRIMVVLTGITFLPGLLLSMTPFLRFVIVLSMLRQAVGLQQSPPNRVLIAISLFLTILLMGPTFTLVNEVSLTPFMNDPRLRRKVNLQNLESIKV